MSSTARAAGAGCDAVALSQGGGAARRRDARAGLDAGEHRLSLRHPGYQAHSEQVTLAGGDDLSLTIDLKPVKKSEQVVLVREVEKARNAPVAFDTGPKEDGFPYATVGWVATGGLTVGAVVTGIVALVTKDERDSLVRPDPDQDPEDADELRGEIDAANTKLRNWSLASDILKGAALAAGGGVGVLSRERLEDHLGIEVVAILAELWEQLGQRRRTMVCYPRSHIAAAQRHMLDRNPALAEQLRESGKTARDEVREVLGALNTGHDGGWATVHANAPADVPARLIALGALAGLTEHAVAVQAVSAIDAVLHLSRTTTGRRLTELGVLQRRGGELVCDPALQVTRGAEVSEGPGWPVLAERLDHRR